MKKEFSVIPRNLILVYNKDKILLQKGHKNKRDWANMYNGLGGHIEKGEDIFDSAARELHEEGGIAFPVNQFLLKGIFSVKTYFNDYCLMFIFSLHTDRKDFTANEEGSLKWIKIRNLDKMKNVAEDIKFLVPVIQKLNTYEMLSGTSEYNTNRKLIRFDYSILGYEY